jgi:hypothetical protein
MPVCGTCSELSHSVDEALLSVNLILKQLQKAIEDRDPNRTAVLELELEAANACKDAAFAAWLEHRKGHDVSEVA